MSQSCECFSKTPELLVSDSTWLPQAAWLLVTPGCSKALLKIILCHNIILQHGLIIVIFLSSQQLENLQ